jgi:hypothetical protein
MVDDAEAKRREDAQAQQQQAAATLAEEQTRAIIRKTLAEAVKNITQADKNTASTEATVYNAILAGLEKGVTPSEVAEVRSGSSAGVPDGVLTMKELEHPEPPPPAPSSGKAKK